ncbi:uncharacterized protein B0I36DRAFT_144290 [Microdochium trichocladiopsis]|uniref:Uncharacterized protein n=1 Tax=Microdochium trichocladiopsis TaxID=1682393 RepID=A0A9P9BS12_9PEZI|nr:uncharacterized protein B0I36DRAFT_144290 [Microdochium trichocladiopsis]KAH7027850.1 hypothetical protein B0I36DRAFT_144290 [Microdochium trichocladiopsis]
MVAALGVHIGVIARSCAQGESPTGKSFVFGGGTCIHAGSRVLSALLLHGGDGTMFGGDCACLAHHLQSSWSVMGFARVKDKQDQSAVDRSVCSTCSVLC